LVAKGLNGLMRARREGVADRSKRLGCAGTGALPAEALGPRPAARWCGLGDVRRGVVIGGHLFKMGQRIRDFQVYFNFCR
jgi:hypothetical protein